MAGRGYVVSEVTNDTVQRRLADSANAVVSSRASHNMRIGPDLQRRVMRKRDSGHLNNDESSRGAVTVKLSMSIAMDT